MSHPSTATPILEARGLVRHFLIGGGLFREPTTIRAVDGVSLAIERGETFAVVGESGCGKSTLARMLLRLIEPTDGAVLYDGRDLTTCSAAEMRALRADLQIVFQDPFSSLNPRMTVGAIIEEPLRVHTNLSSADRRARVAALMRRVGLRADLAGRYPHEFSGGQRQRIGIARALASGPKVLVGDEPVSALDVSIQAQIINLLEDLKTEFGLTLIVIAHDLAVIRHMSDRVAVMYLGEVVELSPTDALYAQPLHPYTQALMRAIPVADPGRPPGEAPLAGDMPSPTNPPPGCRFHTRCPLAVDVCRTRRPALSAATDGRFVACHRWQDAATEPPPRPDPPRRTAAADRRFDLYRRHSRSEPRPTETGPTMKGAARDA